MKFLPLTALTELHNGLRKKFDVEGFALLLLCEQGQYFVTEAHCPHMGARLDGAAVSQGVIRCSHHLYKFSLQSGECLTRGAFCPALRTLTPIEQDGWLGIDAQQLAKWR